MLAAPRPAMRGTAHALQRTRTPLLDMRVILWSWEGVPHDLDEAVLTAVSDRFG
jgi:hypothetical protein